MFTYQGLIETNVELVKTSKGTRYYLRGLYSFGIVQFLEAGYLRDYQKERGLDKAGALIELNKRAKEMKRESVFSPHLLPFPASLDGINRRAFGVKG